MRVVGYVRVSTEEQAADGVSLADQAEKVGLYARLHGHELAEVVADRGASAKSLDRPGLARVLAMLDRREVGGVVVAKLDRLTRSVRDLGRLLDDYFGEGRLQLFSVGDSIDTTTAAGRLMLNVLMSVAQWEREKIVEGTVSALRYKRSVRERISRHVPYGSDLADDRKTLVDNRPELEIIATMRRQRELSGKSFRAIARELNDAGIPAKNGGKWNHTSIRSILKRAAS